MKAEGKSQAYWNELLKRYGLDMDRGKHFPKASARRKKVVRACHSGMRGRRR
jgi:hypothetical protein